MTKAEFLNYIEELEEKHPGLISTDAKLTADVNYFKTVPEDIFAEVMSMADIKESIAYLDSVSNTILKRTQN